MLGIAQVRAGEMQRWGREFVITMLFFMCHLCLSLYHVGVTFGAEVPSRRPVPCMALREAVQMAYCM